MLGRKLLRPSTGRIRKPTTISSILPQVADLSRGTQGSRLLSAKGQTPRLRGGASCCNRREVQRCLEKKCLDYVAGFSVFNDISARDIQFAEMKRGFCNLGKNFASFAPMGPFLVTPDQAGNPDNLEMELRVNGQTRQFSSTKNMVFKMRELVEFFSSMTLEPGDIITSGTPSGVAIYRKPDKTQYLLKPGDLVESKIENLGRLQNTVVAETSPVKTAF